MININVLFEGLLLHLEGSVRIILLIKNLGQFRLEL